LVQRGRDWAGPQPVQAPPRCIKCNNSPINGRTVLITVLLFCGFNVPIERVNYTKPSIKADVQRNVFSVCGVKVR